MQTAIVMNMFYTGLGIARSLGEKGVPVIGLTARPMVYGNFTSQAKILFTFDSREQPEELLQYLLKLGPTLDGRSVIFPTRDHDVVFLDRYREELEEHFSLVIPARSALMTCLNKWETYRSAVEAGVASPKCWLVENQGQLEEVAREAAYPSVLKPVAAHHWRKESNWELVGGRKAIQVDSPEELRTEYAAVAHADPRALVQEMVQGSDDCLTVAACYMDRQGRFAGGFGAQKLLQIPSGFGTGCIVQSVDRPALLDSTIRLLESIHYTGVAEVEYKWDGAKQAYQLIEINPRPWDQHRLGKYSGCDLIYLAYCDHAGLPKPSPVVPAAASFSPCKWVAEDALFFEVMRLFWRRDPALREVKRLLAGKRTFAIWSARDPFPLLAFVIGQAVPWIALTAMRRFWGALKKAVTGQAPLRKEGSKLRKEGSYDRSDEAPQAAVGCCRRLPIGVSGGGRIYRHLADRNGGPKRFRQTFLPQDRPRWKRPHCVHH